ncbi:MAG: Na/Pi cotransporter family protein [bacterium]
MLFFIGLILFLLGLEGSKNSLKSFVDDRAKYYILKITDRMFLSILLGIIITAFIQSSSAVSIMIIGLIEADLLKLKPAICIMFGANIGTTITVQLLSFPIIRYYPILIIAGLIIITFALILKKKHIPIGFILISFGVVFAGLVLMTDFFNSPDMKGLIKYLLKYSAKNRYIGIISGTVITSIIQSSSAVTGITVSLARGNLIDLSSAVAVALGSNIGTCITAFIASINTGSTSKMMAKSHFFFNVIGVICILPFYSIFLELVEVTGSGLVRQIANAHTFFNIFNVLIFLPFLKQFIKMVSSGCKS